MLTEVTKDTTVVVTDPRAIRILQLCALRGALKLEMLGLERHGQSAYSIIKERFMLKGNRARVYEQFCELIEMRKRELLEAINSVYNN